MSMARAGQVEWMSGVEPSSISICTASWMPWSSFWTKTSDIFRGPWLGYRNMGHSNCSRSKRIVSKVYKDGFHYLFLRALVPSLFLFQYLHRWWQPHILQGVSFGFRFLRPDPWNGSSVCREKARPRSKWIKHCQALFRKSHTTPSVVFSYHANSRGECCEPYLRK